MKIPEPAAVDQERAVLRALSVRRFGYACLILMALVSRGAVAQTTIDVTFLPGEFEKPIAVPRTATTVNVQTPVLVCGWPTAARIVEIISGLDGNVLQQRLNEMENYRTALGGAIPITMAMNAIVSPPAVFPRPIPLTAINGATVNLVAGELQDPISGRPRTRDHIVASACLDVAAAQAGTIEFMRIIREYLGLPPPTATAAPVFAPEQMRLPAPAKPAATGNPQSR